MRDALVPFDPTPTVVLLAIMFGACYIYSFDFLFVSYIFLSFSFFYFFFSLFYLTNPKPNVFRRSLPQSKLSSHFIFYVYNSVVLSRFPAFFLVNSSLFPFIVYQLVLPFTFQYCMTRLLFQYRICYCCFHYNNYFYSICIVVIKVSCLDTDNNSELGCSYCFYFYWGFVVQVLLVLLFLFLSLFLLVVGYQHKITLLSLLILTFPFCVVSYFLNYILGFVVSSGFVVLLDVLVVSCLCLLICYH